MTDQNITEMLLRADDDTRAVLAALKNAYPLWSDCDTLNRRTDQKPEVIQPILNKLDALGLVRYSGNNGDHYRLSEPMARFYEID